MSSVRSGALLLRSIESQALRNMRMRGRTRPEGDLAAPAARRTIRTCGESEMHVYWPNLALAALAVVLWGWLLYRVI